MAYAYSGWVGSYFSDEPDGGVRVALVKVAPARGRPRLGMTTFP